MQGSLHYALRAPVEMTEFQCVYFERAAGSFS